ncbi:histone demethylase UTY-like [Clavelina lepadiformis]|uniref:histone demethylase UTY-like n=1 Tax=Clavelina lepadiformis TaxID=159417 RepID=UPI00404115E4
MSFGDCKESHRSNHCTTHLEIETFDSCMYGRLFGNENEQKRMLLKKGVGYYEKLTRKATKCDPVLYCKLGHFHLLLEDYHKALSAYNRYFVLEKDHWKDSPFLYGLGIVYYHFSAYAWSVKLFQQLLYYDPGFSKANEVHCRLGLIFKLTGNHQSAIKHFRQSLSDYRYCSVNKSEILFHLGHLLEIQLQYFEAKKEYEQILTLPATQVKPYVQANTLRQLGWMYHTVEDFGDISLRSATALQFLQRSIEIDPNNGQTWYFLGRYYSSMGKVHDAFVSYRQSIDKSEASADTWCSIGVLYQEQNQPMDALQAYICAVQLDRSHEAAWRDLAVLYEACQQPKDALVCYMNAQHCLNIKHEHTRIEELSRRINSLQEHVDNCGSDYTEGRILPCIEDAWTLPIPAELTQRQSAFKCPPIQQKGQLGSLTDVFTRTNTKKDSSNVVDHSATNSSTPLSEDNLYHEPVAEETLQAIKPKRRKLTKTQEAWQPPSWYLSAPQIQVLQNLRLNRSLLTNHQLVDLERLEHNFSVMSHHQKCISQAQKYDPVYSSESALSIPDTLPLATPSSELPGNTVSSIPILNGSFGSPQENEQNFFDKTCTPNNVSPLSTKTNTLIGLNNTNHCKTEHLKPLLVTHDAALKEASSPSSTVTSLFNGAAVSPKQATPTTSTTPVIKQSICNGKGPPFLYKRNKGMMVSQDQVLQNAHDEDRYNIAIDTPQDTPSSDGGQVSCISAQQANNIFHGKMSPFSNHNSLENVLSPPATLSSVDHEQVFCRNDSLERHCSFTGVDLDPYEKESYLLSQIESRALPHLLRPIGISENVPARDVITTCRRLTCNGTSKHFFLDKCPPPSKPKRRVGMISKEELCPPAPTIYLENKKEAMSKALADFCTNPKNPVTVIRGLAAALKLDLGLFSTKTLVESNPDCTVEVRTQLQQPSEENWDPTGTKKVWLCESSRSYTSIAKYAQYQASTFQESLQEEEMRRQTQTSNAGLDGKAKSEANELIQPNVSKRKGFKTIKFGTNIDLSNEKKWHSQLQELSKLPWLFRLVSAGNMLSHVGHKILGMNTIQLYMKVPGSRTPGHQENNNYSAININIGPGDCEWFAVPEEFWGEINSLCERHNINYLSGSWWPVLEDLYHANIPVYRFIQKPGDMVWLNAGTVHWVQAVGWCNNIAWNVGLVSAYQYQMAVERYEWNKLCGYKSIVPLLQLTWNMAQHVRVTDSKLFSMMKNCMMRSLWQCQHMLDNLKRSNIEVIWHGKGDNEPSHYCETCEVELFNLLFVRRCENLQTHPVHCANCARKFSTTLENFVILNQYQTDELMGIYDQFSLAKKNKT